MEITVLTGLFFAFLAIGALYVRMLTIYSTWEPTEVTKAVRNFYRRETSSRDDYDLSRIEDDELAR